tara:strand:- start:11197 stop:13452 length:2256 start_codon:yes stop_codon:yes gene_type:complete
MTDKFIQEHSEFFENISRKLMAHLSYADLIDESLSESSIKPLVVEALEKTELEKLEKIAQEAKKDIDDTIAIATDMGFTNTAQYLEKLKGELPGTFSLVKMAFSGGDPKKSAEEIGKVTSITSKLNLARDSFNDAVLLFGSELEKLPFAKETTWKNFEKDHADENGQLTIPGLEDVKAGEFVTKVKEEPLIDVIKMAQEYEGLEKFEFPDEDLLRKAAENSYKPPPPPDKFWGKLMSFFGKGDLEAEDFADDIMNASLSKLVAKAAEIKAAQAEAEKDKEQTTAVMDDIGADVQALGQGDTSVVASTAPGGGKGDTAQQTTVNVPGAGAVPMTPQVIQQVAPGFDQKPSAAADKKMVPIPDLEKTVTTPEDVPEGEWLATLINDDPKSSVVFFDPAEAEKAAKEAEKNKDTEGKPEDSAQKPADDTKKEAWVHSRNMSDWLFEATSTKRVKQQSWVHKTSLKKALFTEAIFYKDVAKALKAQGVEDADLPAKAAELAKRLENQYDVQIADLPEVEVEEETVAAAEQIQQSGLTAQDLKDILAQQGEANKQNMEMLRDILASKDESEVQRALARAKEKGVNITNVVTATAEATADAGADTGGDAAPAEEEAEPSKKRDRSGPPSKKMKERGKAVGLKPKEGETGENFGKRVRREEEKQGIRTKKKGGKKPAKKQAAPKKKSGSSASASASASASVSSEALWHRGKLLHRNLVHRAGTLTEVLLGKESEDTIEDVTSNNDIHRWTRLAGLEED